MLHLAFPIRVTATGALATVEQDSDSDVTQSVRLLLTSRPGERRSVPGYGIADQLFAHRIDRQEISRAIAIWEDRATPTQVDVVITELAKEELTDAF